jgi:hypothetical protein
VSSFVREVGRTESPPRCFLRSARPSGPGPIFLFLLDSSATAVTKPCFVLLESVRLRGFGFSSHSPRRVLSLVSVLGIKSAAKFLLKVCVSLYP